MARMLLVEDDEAMRRLCAILFAKTALDGLDIVEADNADDALAALRASSFDAVVTDHGLGATTGIDVLETALRLQPRALRILLTGYVDDALREAATRRARVDMVIEKPADALQLHARIRDVAARIGAATRDAPGGPR